MMGRECCNFSEQSSFFHTSMCFADSVRRQPILAGFQNHIGHGGVAISACKCCNNLAGSHETHDSDSGFFNRLSASFFAIDESHQP